MKLPAHIDRTDRYSGSFVTFLDSFSGATLATPLDVPLTIERHIVTVPGTTTAHVSLIHETITAHMGDKAVVQQSGIVQLSPTPSSQSRSSRSWWRLR